MSNAASRYVQDLEDVLAFTWWAVKDHSSGVDPKKKPLIKENSLHLPSIVEIYQIPRYFRLAEMQSRFLKNFQR